MEMKNGLKILLFCEAWSILALGMLAPIYAIFVEKIGGDILDASWGYFAFMFTSGITIYLISHWEDSIRHKAKLVIMGYLFTTVGCIMYIFVNSQAMLVATQIILGLATAIKDPAYDALYTVFLDKNHEASEWGDWEFVWYIATAIAALVGGYMVSFIGFNGLFLLMGFASFISMLIALLLLQRSAYLRAKHLS